MVEQANSRIGTLYEAMRFAYFLENPFSSGFNSNGVSYLKPALSQLKSVDRSKLSSEELESVEKYKVILEAYAERLSPRGAFVVGLILSYEFGALPGLTGEPRAVKLATKVWDELESYLENCEDSKLSSLESSLQEFVNFYDQESAHTEGVRAKPVGDRGPMDQSFLEGLEKLRDELMRVWILKILE